MKNLRVTTVQSALVWQNINANLELFAAKLKKLKGKTDLIVLPEMFTTGFSMQPESLAENMSGRTMTWLSENAKQIDAAIMASFIVSEDGKYYNRLVFMRPDGTYEYYDKRHLFTLAGEHEKYAAGTRRLTVEWRGWKICPLICYDLRFPVWSRNNENYELLIYVANWPITRSHHWKSLLTARAIENQSYTIGVNRVGKDANELLYSGDTSIIDYSGNILHQVSNREDIFTMTLYKEQQNDFRSKLNFLPDAGEFKIINS